MLDRSPCSRQSQIPDARAMWSLLLSLKESYALGRSWTLPRGFVHDAGLWSDGPLDDADVLLDPDAPRGFVVRSQISDDARELLELFTPLFVGDRASTLLIAHIAQSLDGRIATPTGASQFITGAEDLTHTHRLRALCDAVVVGARTVSFDNPRLTTRRCEGRHATRVVLDPSRRLSSAYSVFSDAVARTILVCDPALVRRGERMGEAEVIGVPTLEGRFDLRRLLETLRELGLRRLFVEGGGITVSHFLAQGLLDRLHVTTAPMILGSGTSSIALSPIDRLDEAVRFAARPFLLGRDVLFDCDLRAGG